MVHAALSPVHVPPDMLGLEALPPPPLARVICMSTMYVIPGSANVFHCDGESEWKAVFASCGSLDDGPKRQCRWEGPRMMRPDVT